MFFRYLVATVIAILISFTALPSQAEVEGLITQPSENSVEVTIEKFEAAAEERGLTIFARLDHAAAESVGLEMPAATVIVFGNPRIGTPTFIETPTVAIDLPPKAMVWEDAEGNVFLSYNSAEHLFNTIYPRHGIPADEETIANVASAYAAIADAAIN